MLQEQNLIMLCQQYGYAHIHIFYSATTIFIILKFVLIILLNIPDAQVFQEPIFLLALCGWMLL